MLNGPWLKSVLPPAHSTVPSESLSPPAQLPSYEEVSHAHIPIKKWTTYLDAHRSLRVVLAVDRDVVGVGKSTDSSAVDDPLDAVLVPIDRVSVPCALGIGDGVVFGTLVGGCVALSVEVALHLVCRDDRLAYVVLFQ